MKKLLFLALLLCSVSVWGQIQTNVTKQCYLLYDFDGKSFNKNKKIKEGTTITLTKESDRLIGFYEVLYKGKQYVIKENCINQKDLSLLPKDSLAIQKYCKAITKAGKRCSRLHEPGNVYCWQHKKIQSIRKIFILDNKIESSTRDHEGADIILIAKGIKYISKIKFIISPLKQTLHEEVTIFIIVCSMSKRLFF